MATRAPIATVASASTPVPRRSSIPYRNFRCRLSRRCPTTPSGGRSRRICRAKIPCRYCVFSPGSPVPSDDSAYFRQEALSSATTMRFFARKPCRRRRRSIFSSGRPVVGDDGAFFCQEGLSSATTMHFFARKLCRSLFISKINLFRLFFALIRLFPLDKACRSALYLPRTFKF